MDQISPTVSSFLLFVLVLLGKADSIPIDNSIISDPVVNCRSDSLAIDIKTAKAFGGRVFVKGYSQDSNCNLVGDGLSTFDFSINFNNCGLRRTREINGVSISAIVVISFHPIFITKVDRAYKLNCFYLEAKKTVQQQIDVSELTTQTLSRQTTMPVCKYDILSDGPTGKAVKYARIGDHVYHRWSCETDTPGVYCMKVHSCSVSDGQGGEHVLVLDEQGCEIDRFVLQNLDYSGDMAAGQGAHVFKFADKPSLHFNCQIELSLKDPQTGCKLLHPQCPVSGLDGYSSNNGQSGSDYGSSGSQSNSGYGAASTTASENYGESITQAPTSKSSIPGYGEGDTTELYESVDAQTTQSYVEENGGYANGEEEQYAQKSLPGAIFRVVPEASTGGYSEYDSGYTTKSGYSQTQVAPSSKVAEAQYEELATPVAIGYDAPTPPSPAALVFNDLYQDETELPPLENKSVRKLAIKRHTVDKRKVADFDLPEQSLVVIEIDEEDPISKSFWEGKAESGVLKGECVSAGMFGAVTFIAVGMGLLLCISIAISIRRNRSTELNKYLASKI